MRYTALVLISTLAGACVHRPAPRAAAAPKPTPGRCARALDAVSDATHPSAAVEATSEYLSCIATWETAPPPDLEGEVASALQGNPYPQTRREAPEILARFFDPGRLRELPRNRRDLETYREVLDAQILRAQAQRDEKFAAAAEARAQSLRTLTQVLESMDGRE